MTKSASETDMEEPVLNHPLLKRVIRGEEIFWYNPHYASYTSSENDLPLSGRDIRKAEERLKRFAPYIAAVFPETASTGGIIESPLKRLSAMGQFLSRTQNIDITGNLFLKCDNQLAVSGSIKARGGIYEVLKHAETLAFQHNLLSADDNYTRLDTAAFRRFFSDYAIAVGSTGNLGLSIGIMGARLGFRVFVHMSADAKEWKKNLLKEKGVTVIEHASDYSKAVEEGRKQAALDKHTHFIDDENSTDLFLGYSTAASGLKKQLEEHGVKTDKDHPLFVYLPCGVGGGPGGITFGLKQIFKDNVHCFFAEPTASPCMLLGLMTRLHEKANVRDFGLDNITTADGLAVASPSGFVGKTLEKLISGVFTVQDQGLYKMLRKMIDIEAIPLEPSAVAGLPGVGKLLDGNEGKRYLKTRNLTGKMADATHVVWATGGSMVPDEVMNTYYEKAAD